MSYANFFVKKQRHHADRWLQDSVLSITLNKS